MAPNAGVWEGAAGNGDPNDEPKEGVAFAPKPPDGVELNTNVEGTVDAAADEAAEGAAAPKLKEG